MTEHHHGNHDHTGPDHTESSRRWLSATWPSVQQHLPSPPGRVLDLGCGPLGGFVPALRSAGYDAYGIDPEAPAGPHFHQVEFEQWASAEPATAVVASTSLHHVADLDAVVGLIARRLEPDGVLIVLEWARERFDEASAQWCFDRLGADEGGWLRRRHEDWLASGRDWDAYLDDWARTEGLHSGEEILRALAGSFVTLELAYGPYFFADLPTVAVDEERDAIATGVIRANGITYVGRAGRPTP